MALFLSKLVGCDGWDASADWIAGHYERLREALTLWVLPPSADTLRRMAEHVEMKGFFKDMVGEGKLLQIDGKRARGAKADGKIHHFIEALHGKQVVGMVESEEGAESPAIITLLRSLNLEGLIVTIDAAGTTPAVVETIRERNGDYLLTVEANQPILLKEIRQAFAENPAAPQVTKDYGHGRNDIRRARTLTRPDIISRLSAGERVPDIQAICWIQRTRITSQGIETTDQFHIASWPLKARDYLGINRGHWGIEAMHYVLDVSLNEDRSRIAKAAAVVAAMRRNAYAIIDSLRGKLSYKRFSAKMRADPTLILNQI